MTEPLSIAWLTTGRGPGSFGAIEHLFRAIDEGLPVRPAVIFVNRDRGEAEATDRLIALVEGRGVPVETLSSVRFRKERGGQRSKPGEPLPAWRTEYDAAVAAKLGRYEFSLGVLFGYMLIATEPLYDRFRLINDHPALPDGPIGTYQQVIVELMRTGARESGCMWHAVTGDVDRGRAISYCRFPIYDDDSRPLWLSYIGIRGMAEQPADEDTLLYAEIRRRGVARERPLMVETLRALAERRLAADGHAALLDLTEAVERSLLEPQPRAG